MLRRKTGGLLVLGLMVAALVVVSQALAAQSHLDAWCNNTEVADETSETGGVSKAGYGSASASLLHLQAWASASAQDTAENHYCDVGTSFSNTVQIDPGSSGLSVGDPVTLALTVTLNGEIGADVVGPATPDAPSTTTAIADVSAAFGLTAPDRPVCYMEDGKEYCNPAEIGSFLAAAHRILNADVPTDPTAHGRLYGNDEWWWVTRSNGVETSHDEGGGYFDCDWYLGSHACGGTTVPPPQTPDYRGTRTFLVDAFVGDRLKLDGQLSVGATAQNGSAHADFPTVDLHGFRAALAPAAGFEGLRLSYEQSPPVADLPPVCQPVAAQTAEDTPLDDALTCSDESPSTLSYALSTGPAHGQVVLTSDGQYTYTPAENFNGQDSFQVTATDDGGKVSAPAIVAVTVNPVNDRPVCWAKSAFATVGQTAQLDAACDDVDRDPLTIAIAAQGTKGTATVNGLEIDYTPTEAGTDSFTYTASDGTLTSPPATVTVTNLPAPASLTMTITQGLVVFRKPPDDDRARFTGTFASSDPVTCNQDVTVSLNTSVFAQTVPGSAFRSQNNGQLCVYTRLTAGGTGGIKRLELNLATKTFLVKLRDEVELSPLTNPVTLGLKIGSLSTSQTIQMKQAKNRWTYPS